MRRLPGFDKLFKFFNEYRWALLSGVLVGTSYVPFPPWAVAFCWVPLWWASLQTTNLKSVFKQAWISQFVLTIIGFHWISYVSHEFGFMPWPIAIAVLLLFASTVHIYIALAVVTARYLGKKFQLTSAAQLILMAVFHVTGEAYWPSLFSWNLGYTLYWAKLSVFQIADVIGFLGLSLLLHFLNALVVWVILKKDFRTVRVSFSAVVFVFAGLSIWGTMKGRHWTTTDESLSVMLVQANIGNFEKIMSEKGRGYQSEITAKYFDLTKQTLKQHPEGGKVQLIVWPETAFPDFLGNHNAHREHTQSLVKFVQEIARPVMTGGYGNEVPGKFPRSEFNALFLYGAEGQVLGDSYKKTNLLAFGEYTPFGEVFPILKKYNPGGAGWGPGSGPVTLELNDIRFGPQICYDSLYDWFSAASTRNGAQILVNLTNDSWFGPRSEPAQHMIMTLARAVENRRPLIRSTNTGISTIALANGDLLEQSPLFQPWAQIYSVPFRKNPELTFFTRWRYLFPWLLALVAGLMVFFGRTKRD